MSSPTRSPASGDGRRDGSVPQPPRATLARVIWRTRFVLLLAVAAVLLVAGVFFLLASWLAVLGVWHAVRDAVGGDLDTTSLTVEFLEVVSAMLKAVVFYLVGVGLYSLFIAPLNLAAALDVDTLSDLETKLTSVIILIMAVTFLEHFIRWEEPDQILRVGGGFALVVAALVLFQFYNHRIAEAQKQHPPESQTRAQHELFDQDREERDVVPQDAAPTGDRSDRR